jgi:hypothetical protein
MKTGMVLQRVQLGLMLFALWASALAPSPSAAARARVITFIGESSTAALYSPPGFPKLVGDLMHVQIHNLATKYPPSYSTLQALSEELPNLPAGTTDAVMYIGVGDLRSLASGDTTLAIVEEANAKIIAALHAKHIRVYELTIRDYTHEPAWHAEPYDVPTMDKIPAFVAALNAYYKATPNITVIDQEGWHDVYAGNWSSDGVHFLPDALHRFAKHLAQALAAR